MTLMLSCAVAMAGCSSSPAKQVVSAAITTQQADLVDMQTLVPDIALDIRYAGMGNFVGEIIDGYDA